MMKRLTGFIVLCILAVQPVLAKQLGDTTIRIHRVAIFAPLYLDSAYSGFDYNFGKKFPRFVLPGLDFINGAQIALDTLPKDNEKIEAFIYDTRSSTYPISWLENNNKFDSIDLIIGSVKDQEFKQLAEIAESRKIPFISATYPNDAGITKNPYLVILNSTLRAHCEGIYAYLLQNYGTRKVLLCRKRGSLEDKIASYFRAANEVDGKQLINIQTLYFDTVITAGLLKARLDTSKETVIIAGSLDEDFANKLTNAAYSLSKTNDVVLMGMPNWDGFEFLTRKNAFKDFPIHFTSPYYNTKEGKYSELLTAEFLKKYNSKPSDMAFKGFESVYLFTRLLLNRQESLISTMANNSLKLINEYAIKPVNLKKSDRTDYYENKHLYILKIFNGELLRAW